jgi:hypothetical protein
MRPQKDSIIALSAGVPTAPIDGDPGVTNL